MNVPQSTDLVSDETLRAWLKGAEEHIESGVATDMVAVCPLALQRACREIQRLRSADERRRERLREAISETSRE